MCTSFASHTMLQTFPEGLNQVHPAMHVLERSGPVVEMAQRNCFHQLHPNKSSPLLYNPRSYRHRRCEGLFHPNYKAVIAPFLFSPGLHKPSSSGNPPCRAPFSIHTCMQSLCSYRQGITNTRAKLPSTPSSLVPPMQFGTLVLCWNSSEGFEYYHEFLNPWYQKAELYHPIALKELRLHLSEMGKEGLERAQDQEEERSCNRRCYR